jgi:hypothetical protein
MIMSHHQAEALIREWGHAQGLILWADIIDRLQSQLHTVDERLREAMEVMLTS